MQNDRINQALVDEIHKEGEFFISTTVLNDKVVLRLAILTTRTNREAVDSFIVMLENKINRLKDCTY